MLYVIRMTTEKGEFWWDGAAMWDRKGYSPFRLWGWHEDPYRAQRYVKSGNAKRQASTLYNELNRLYRIQIDVVAVKVTMLGVRIEGVIGVGWGYTS